eukprot:266409_1
MDANQHAEDILSSMSEQEIDEMKQTLQDPNDGNINPNTEQETDFTWSIPPQPHYAPTVPKYGDTNINEDGNCPAMYTRSWSDALVDIVKNHCRKYDIGDTIPKVIFETVAVFYSNDHTHHRSYGDYVDALLICKYFSRLKESKRNQLNETDKAVKKQYKLTKKSVLGTAKIMKALNEYKKSNSFEINGGKEVEDFEVLFVDHEQNKYNLQKHSYPNNIDYTISNDELCIITAVRDTIELNRKHPVTWNGKDAGEVYRAHELVDITHKQYFKTGKTSVRMHTLISYMNKYLFAVDYDNRFAYFMFVFKFFSIVIHDKVEGRLPVERTMKARAIASKYKGILEQFDNSGL